MTFLQFLVIALASVRVIFFINIKAQLLVEKASPYYAAFMNITIAIELFTYYITFKTL